METQNQKEHTSQIVEEEAPCQHVGCTEMARLAAGYCLEHLEENTGYVLKESSVKGAGLGLYAGNKMIPSGTKLVYSGDRLTQQEFRERYSNGLSDYVLTSMGYYIDARSTQSCLARYVCDSRIFKNVNGTLYLDYVRETNCKYIDGEPYPFILMTKDIRPGEELLINYGDGYWMSRPGFSLNSPPPTPKQLKRKTKTKVNSISSTRINKSQTRRKRKQVV